MSHESLIVDSAGDDTDILRLDANSSEADPGRMDILLEYRMRRTLHRDTLVVPVNLTREDG